MIKRILSISLSLFVILGLCSCGQEKVAETQFGNIKYSFPYVTEAVTELKPVDGIENNEYLSGLNFINDDTPVIIPEKVKPSKDRVAGEPYAVDVKYDDGTGVCVAIYDVVKDFGAKNDGSKNASGAIQQALTAASKAGGGVVYIPEGKYLCESFMEIPSGVTLRGEWVSPEVSPAGSCGTVLLVQNKSRGREGGTAFIKMKAGSGVRNLTILYPDQTTDEVAKYPAAIQEAGGDSFSVINTTIAGCWNGYQGNLNWSELHYLKNVYITAFNRAIMLDNITDIGRLEGVHLSPRYFTDNTLYPFSEEDKAILKDYMHQYAIGLWMQRSDWQYVYDFTAEGLYMAIHQEYNSENRAANAQYCNLNLINNNIGIDIQATNAIGCVFTDVNITGDDKCAYGVLLNAGFSESCDFQNLRISGPIKEQFSCIGSGHVIMTNSRFEKWNDRNFALNMHKGSISVQQIEFIGKKNHAMFAPETGGVSVLGCTYGENQESIRYDKSKEGFVKIDNTPLNLPKTSGRLHIYRRSIPTASTTAVYNVVDFGAKDGEDSTEAFEKALETAGEKGGVVYVPGGKYTISKSLTVPSGVELRGVYNVPTHSVAKGSVILTDLGKGDANGEALIKLSAGSGINGMSFYYPNQKYDSFVAYPYTVQSRGENCWAVNTVFINSYQAMDFGTYPSKGHYINYVSGAPLLKGIFIGNNDGNGWVENCQFNPHYWKRSDIVKGSTASSEGLNLLVNKTLDCFILGDNASEHMLSNFAYDALNLLRMVSQGKGGTNGTIIGHGSDGCQNALVVDDADTVEFINAELVSMDGEGEMHHIIMKETCKGTVALFNSMGWAQPTPCPVEVRGGRLVIAQFSYYNLDKATYLAGVKGGELVYSSVMLLPKTFHVLGQGGKVSLVGNVVKQSLSFAAPAGGAKVLVHSGGAKCTEAGTWWY